MDSGLRYINTVCCGVRSSRPADVLSGPSSDGLYSLAFMPKSSDCTLLRRGRVRGEPPPARSEAGRGDTFTPSTTYIDHVPGHLTTMLLVPQDERNLPRATDSAHAITLPAPGMLQSPCPLPISFLRPTSSPLFLSSQLFSFS